MADAAQRRVAHGLLLEVAADKSGLVHSFGLNHAGVEGIHANLLGAEFLRERDGDGVDRALGARVDGCSRDARRGDRTDVDDAAALGAEVRERRLSGQAEGRAR